MNGPMEQDAVAMRLRKLAAMPLDTSAASARIMAAIPRAEARRSFKLSAYWSRAAAVAASLIIAVTLLTLSFWPNEAVASPAEFARIHREMVRGETPAMVATSFEQANRLIAEQWNGFSGFTHGTSPDWVPHACCLRDVKNAKVAFALISIDGKKVSVAVARAQDIRSPAGKVEMHNGQPYHISTVDEFTMVMTEHDGRWVCLTGEKDASALIDAANKLGF